MNTEFSLLDRNLTLIRYPAKQQHKSLQAWDSADELIIQHLHDQGNPEMGNLLIVNDDFGALGCWFAHYSPTWLSDSWISRCSLLENLQHNQLSESALTLCETLSETIRETLSSRSARALTASVPAMEIPTVDAPAANALALDATFDTVLIKVPRTLALLEQQLIELRTHITPNTTIIAAGKVNQITKSVLNLFERYLGPTTTSLARKKSRLIFSQVDSANQQANKVSPYPTTWPLTLANNTSVSVFNHANVFSRQSLDIGARFMLQHMLVKDGERVVDLGCGNGVLGMNALAMAENIAVTFVDESFMALQSASENVAHNFPERAASCRYIASNCLESLLNDDDIAQVDRILCNPPFHQQNAITDHIAWQMFSESKSLLRRGGHLIVVANRHLGHHDKLKRIFGGYTVLASDKKFVILDAVNR